MVQGAYQMNISHQNGSIKIANLHSHSFICAPSPKNVEIEEFFKLHFIKKHPNS